MTLLYMNLEVEQLNEYLYMAISHGNSKVKL